MKKILLVVPLLLSGTILCAMDKMGASISHRDPFMQLPLENDPKLTQDQLVQIIKDGKYDDLARELNRGLKADFIFTVGSHAGKSLLQVAFEHSITNRRDIASMLLKRGANTQDLNKFFVSAIKKFDADEVKWLLEHGANAPADALSVVKTLEKAAQGAKKEKLLSIKTLLEEHTPAALTNVNVPDRPSKPQIVTQLPVVVKFDTRDQFTVLGQAKEQELFKAVLAGDEIKLGEFLKLRLSPDFVFTLGSPGKSILTVVVTESLKNQEKLTDLLIAYGANTAALNKGLSLAIERFELPKVQWLIARGVQPTDADIRNAENLEKNTAHPAKKKVAAEINAILKKHQPSQYNKPLPPVPLKRPVLLKKFNDKTEQ